MATQQSVWGIDIGQCALKALRITVDPNASEGDVKFVADAFDHIEYPKILSQPEAEPVVLVREALEQFLSRNEIRKDRVAISVPGQAGLARFIKLPPVESKKIPDIVKFEAKQQIPFELSDVIWDFQRMSGGTEEEGFSLETEVGLFAMKRDQVFAALEPLTDAGIDVDFVQLAPLAIYNFVVADQFGGLPDVDEYDPDDPPESLIVMAMGTDTTDLVITNGFRVWQRNIPIGGNHFTKALTKELKLTFSKAEHLKRNATRGDDPKAIFQAMRPVFSDLLTEIRRSVGYFMNLNREAKVRRGLALGNAMRLPGLQKYLVQNLGYEVVQLKSFDRLSGSGVVGAPVFKENVLSFPVAYGLAIQGTGKSTLATNLVPREIVRDRIIRKKPWAVATAATILVACTISFFGHWRPWNAAQAEDFKTAQGEVTKVDNEFKRFETALSSKNSELSTVRSAEDQIKVNVDERYQFPEVLTALATALPWESVDDSLPENRKQIHITGIQCLYEPNLASWKSRMAALDPKAVDEFGVPLAEESADEKKRKFSRRVNGTFSGAGWILRLKGYHLYNELISEGKDIFVNNHFLKSFGNKEIHVVDIDGEPGKKKITLKELGLLGGEFTWINTELPRTIVLNPDHLSNPASDRGRDNPLRYEFSVELVFKPKPIDQRRTTDIPPPTLVRPADTTPKKN